MTIEEQLDQYAELVERQELLQKQMQELIDKVPVPQEIVDQWNAIKAEFQPMIDAVSQSVETLKQDIQSEVLYAGATAKGTKYMAVWNKGRETWSGDLLNGYAIAHPDILACKKIGDPSVTFRKIK